MWIKAVTSLFNRTKHLMDVQDGSVHHHVPGNTCEIRTAIVEEWDDIPEASDSIIQSKSNLNNNRHEWCNCTSSFIYQDSGRLLDLIHSPWAGKQKDPHTPCRTDCRRPSGDRTSYLTGWPAWGDDLTLPDPSVRQRTHNELCRDSGSEFRMKSVLVFHPSGCWWQSTTRWLFRFMRKTTVVVWSPFSLVFSVHLSSPIIWAWQGLKPGWSPDDVLKKQQGAVQLGWLFIGCFTASMAPHIGKDSCTFPQPHRDTSLKPFVCLGLFPILRKKGFVRLTV